jgi:tRNA pseudouridine55 synthase
MATGVLPLCIGEGTKLAPYLLADDKEYEGQLILGTATDTLDACGKVIATAAIAGIDGGAVARAIAELALETSQVPPMYSAIRQNGQRLYQMAREGIVTARKPRPIAIFSFELLAFEAPEVRFRVACSKGTYIRVLAHDLATRLGTVGHLGALRRIRSGRFHLSQAVTLSVAEALGQKNVLVPPPVALEHLPPVEIPDHLLHAVENGQRLLSRTLGLNPPPIGPLRLLSRTGNLLALARFERGALRYERVFTYGLTEERKSSNLLGQIKN